MDATRALPAAVAALLDGTRLDERIGVTLQVIVADGELPRVTTVSVGEVLAITYDRFMLTMYATSRTARVLAVQGHGLLCLVEGGAIVKVAFTAEPRAASDGRSMFRCTVESVERDEVPYARVADGIRFELLPGHDQVIDRWRAQLSELREQAS